jgi:ankyrin repeat protein
MALWEEMINGLRKRHAPCNLRFRGSIDKRKLVCAVADADVHTVQRLLDEGVDVNERDQLQHTALHHVAASGNFLLCHLLLEAGADVNARGVDGDDPCMLAASQGHSKVLQLLMDKGAQILKSPHIVTFCFKSTRALTFDNFGHKGAGIDTANLDGLTPRHVINMLASEILFVADSAATNENAAL